MLEIKPVPMPYPVLKPRKIKKDDHCTDRQMPKRPKPEAQNRPEHIEHIDEII
jgi:hypothetical protein